MSLVLYQQKVNLQKVKRLLTSEPVVYRVRGVNFMPIGNMLQSLSKRNKIMYNTLLEF